MLLSIIVPVYNVEPYLLRSLRSLLDQGFEAGDLEVIVIDDGSDDGSLAVAEALALQHPNVVIHHQANLGPSVARNVGIGLATGTYLYFVDADDHVASRMLRALVELMEREALQVVGFGVSEVRPDVFLPLPRSASVTTGHVKVTTGAEYMATHAYRNAPWWYLVSRAFVIEAGLRFEPGRLRADAIFTANVLARAGRFAFVPVDVYRYARRPGSISRTWTDASTRKLVADHERVVFGLEELRQELIGSGTASPALLARLVNRQQAFVFFLIARLMRSGVAPRPLLPDALERLRAIDMYPLTRFPGPDDRDARFRVLTAVFNRSYLLYPGIRIYRWLAGLRRRV